MTGTLVLTKLCPSCRRKLPRDAFRDAPSRPLGLECYCRECLKKKGAAYRARPQVKAAEKAKKAQYYLDNRERISQRTAAYRREHPELYRQAHLAWQKRNPEECARLARTRRAFRVSAPCIPYTQEQLTARLSMFPFCYLCGGEPQAVDHIKPLAKGGWDCLSNFRSICHSCNGRKKDKWPFAEAMVLRRRNHGSQIL